MLAEPGVRYRQGVPIFPAAMHIDGKSQADGRRFAILFDDFDADTLDRLGNGVADNPYPVGATWEDAQSRAELLDQIGRIAPPDADHESISHEMFSIKSPHVVQRDTLHAGNGSFGQMAVRRAGENRVVKLGLGKLFVARITKGVFQHVERAAFDAIEVCLLESGFEDGLRKQRDIIFEIVLVDAAGNDRHFDTDRRAVSTGHGRELVENFFVTMLFGGRFGKHRGRDGGQPFFAARIVLRANLEPQPEANGRVFRGGHGDHLRSGDHLLGLRGLRDAGRENQEEDCKSAIANCKLQVEQAANPKEYPS